MAYTGQSNFTENDPPTFVTVSENDPIANVSTVERRVTALRKAGIEVEFVNIRMLDMALDLLSAQMPKGG
jgi:acetyl esterase/lipase